MAGVAASAVADTIPRRLADYRFANESWDIRPAYEPATGLVSGIVAVAKPDAVIGDNLSVVMFVRTSGNQWSAWSWAGTTRAEGVMGAKHELNIPDEDDPKWEIDEPINLFNGEDWLIPADPYMAGMLTNDPLFEPVMNSENPEALVAMLAELGYPVATAGRPLEGGGESDGACPEQERDMLMGMADATEFAATMQPQTESDTASVLASMSQMLMTCEATPCTANSTPWVVTNAPANCGWFLVNAKAVTVMGGIRHECTYESRRYFRFTRTRTVTATDCSTTVEAQCVKGFVKGETLLCTKNIDDGAAYTCPAVPESTCANPANPPSICVTGTAPPTPTSGWGPPPCP